MLRICLITLLVAAGGCPGGGGTITTNGDTGVPSDADGGLPPPQDLGNHDVPVVYACDIVDILFVIDNSNSMFEEQENLVANFPKFIQAIEAIQPPIKSSHVGVISTDIGAGPFSGPLMGSCVPGGDEGKLQHTPTGADAGCAASYPKYLEGPASTLSQDFGCIARLGVGGCGYEQQMEAALKALTAQPYNDGFMRKNAPLAIIFVTDEDDCSAEKTGLFNPDDQSLGPYPARCVNHLDRLYPVSRYIQGFKALKTKPERVVVAAITGPAGKVETDPTTGVVTPVCSSPEFGSSLPGNRFDALVKGFGDRGVLESLCQGDLAQPLGVIGKAIERACLE
jgi:hypothetical protein